MLFAKLKIKGEKQKQKSQKFEKRIIRIFQADRNSGKRQSTEKKIDLLGVRLSIQTYSVCMVFFGYWRTS